MTSNGGVAEWSNALVSKTSMLERVSEVRILPPPQIVKLVDMNESMEQSVRSEAPEMRQLLDPTPPVPE
ncbi:MAG: hypothetical protein RLZZ308_584, partial [Candidatus Parcubacteria bacterium]